MVWWETMRLNVYIYSRIIQWHENTHTYIVHLSFDVDGQMSFLEESRAPNRLALDAHVDLNVQLSI